MPLSTLLQKASHLFLGYNSQTEDIFNYDDNDILFCKNNICVHPTAIARHEFENIHYPGYLTVTTKVFTDQHNKAKRPTLFLNWIPNSSLKKGEAKSDLDSRKCSPNNEAYLLSPRSFLKNPQYHNNNRRIADLNERAFSTSDNSETTSINSDRISVKSSDSRGTDLWIADIKINAHQSSSEFNFEKHTRSSSMSSMNITIAKPMIQNVMVAPENTSDTFVRSHSLTSCTETNPNWITSTEFVPLKHNLNMSGSATNSPVFQRKGPVKCRRFSVDLSQMRSLRLFFNNEDCTCGQLVVASRESQYKILHFHFGGLDRLAQVLHKWHSLLHNIKSNPGLDESNLPYRHFMVCRPEVQRSEQHPEEGKVIKISPELFYKKLLNCKGQIEDDLLLRKGIFFGGLDKELRHVVWPFLLHCYPFNSTFDEREAIFLVRKQEYINISKQRTHMTPEKHGKFLKNVENVIEKDVVRTDRRNPFFVGENNVNIELMKNILLNYAVYNPILGYTQGMSDLLAPVLCEIKDEVETFWCFVGLMQRTMFVCTPTDNDMDINLGYLRELIKLMLPEFYDHIHSNEDATELLFCHRWILLCFKREFPESIALRMWEACWSNYLTDYFNLFISLAIIAVYSDDVVSQSLRTDEMLLYFSSLASYMDGQLILCKARGLLHHFRQLTRIPCTLAGLCQKCGPGIWDSNHRPSIECKGHQAKCPYMK